MVVTCDKKMPKKLLKCPQEMSLSLQDCGRINGNAVCSTPVSGNLFKSLTPRSVGKLKASTPVIIKVPAYKSVEEAIIKMKFSELKKLMDMSRIRCPNSPISLLTDLVSYLNLKLNVKEVDSVYFKQPKLYPLNICPKELTDMIEIILSDCSPDILKPFFESVLKCIAEDRRKGLSTNGHHIVIQASMLRWPNVVLDNINEMIRLRNVYKKSQSDCLTFLWAIGQVGVNDFKSGIRVWMEVMLPLLGIKAYSSFIVQYLKDLLSWHSHSSTSLVLEIHTFFPLMDVIFYNSANLDISSHKELMNLYPNIKKLALRSNSLRRFFPSFLTRLEPTCPLLFRNELLSNLTQCLINDIKCFGVWTQLLSKHVPQSKGLLEHICKNWERLCTKLPEKIMMDTLRTWLSQSMKSVPSNVVPQFQECKIICQELMTKMHSSNAKNHNSSSHHKNRNNANKHPQPHFPWILVIFVSLTALAGLVMYDITTKGSFKASNTRQILNDWGISSMCDTTWKFVKLHSINIFRWCETNVPVYYKTATEFCAPYMIPVKVKCYELGIGFLEIFNAMSANIAEIVSPILTWVDTNFPPFLKTVREYLLEIFTYAIMIATPVINGTIDIMHDIYRWVMENVLIGQLDPQNLQKSAISAVGAVQEYTVNLFKWLSQQVFTS